MLTKEALNEFKVLWKKNNPDQKIDEDRLKIIAEKVFEVVMLTYNKD